MYWLLFSIQLQWVGTTDFNLKKAEKHQLRFINDFLRVFALDFIQ